MSAQGSALTVLGAISALIALRITRRWNQTGQKYAGEPDIARTYLSENIDILWYLVGAAYLWNTYSLTNHGFLKLPRLAAIAISSTLVTLAITFKLAFTMEDSPELLGGISATLLDPSPGLSLVNKARVVFASIAIALGYTIFSDTFFASKLNRKGSYHFHFHFHPSA